ncbi:hypothetical protein NPIL_303601 [Nephila pilipes]|uniref:Uncharacterized protein n=1 Tax=Nephila pilipes TaxID=299642 RepID=A0A8X6QKY0_NEPPI|nr:hypothetical protein NPIL_303601 [Nephila pilipes]
MGSASREGPPEKAPLRLTWIRTKVFSLQLVWAFSFSFTLAYEEEWSRAIVNGILTWFKVMSWCLELDRAEARQA